MPPDMDNMRRAILMALLVGPGSALADSCRCLEQLEHPTKEHLPKFVAADCPEIKPEAGYRGESIQLRFNQITAEGFYGLLADFSGARVCFGSAVSDGYLKVNVPNRTPWNVVAEDVARQHGYRALVTSRMIYVYAPSP
jgi:hypothetical protein